MSKEPHDGQSSNRLNSVLANRGGGGIQPRNCPVPRRCHWMAHPSSKGKRGSNYRRSRRKRDPPNEQRSDWGGGDGHWCVRPIEPSRDVPDRHRGGGSSPTVLRQRAEHREKGREQTGARRARRVIRTRPRTLSMPSKPPNSATFPEARPPSACHIGRDTLCLVRRGAVATGLDFSGVALDVVRRLSNYKETGLKAYFVQGTVDEAPLLTPGPFDLVFTTWGTIF